MGSAHNHGYFRVFFFKGLSDQQGVAKGGCRCGNANNVRVILEGVRNGFFHAPVFSIRVNHLYGKLVFFQYRSNIKKSKRGCCGGDVLLNFPVYAHEFRCIDKAYFGGLAGHENPYLVTSKLFLKFSNGFFGNRKH